MGNEGLWVGVVAGATRTVGSSGRRVAWADSDRFRSTPAGPYPSAANAKIWLSEFAIERLDGMAISTRTRFEVLKRDGFTCQYCGRNRDQDNVKLHVDHVIPIKEGGGDALTNLVTACSDCNLGKSAVPLGVVKLPDPTDAAARLAAAALYEENSQRLHDLVERGCAMAEERWAARWENPTHYPYTSAIKAWVRDFGAVDVIASIDKACDKCDTSYDAVRYLGGIYRNKRKQPAEPIVAVEEEVRPCATCAKQLKSDEIHFCEPCWADWWVANPPTDGPEDEWVVEPDEIDLEVKAWDDLADAAGF